MSPSTLLSGLGALSALLWLRAQRRALDRRREIPALPQAAPGPVPEIGVIVPARDEGRALERTVADLLRQEGLTVSVVVVDDRSDPPVRAFEDPRVRLVRLDLLPEGWLGKPHALAAGLAALDPACPLVLFTDADVRFAPDALRRAAAQLEAEGLEHLCLLPTYDDRGLLLRAAIGAGEGLLLAGRRAHEVGRSDRSSYLGLGAFGLFRRGALERAGGLAPVRMAVLDDMALARELRDAGARAGVRRAGALVHLEWYGRLSALVRGLEKTHLAAARFRPLRAAALGSGLLLVGLGPILTALLAPVPWARWTAIFALAGQVVVALAARSREGRPFGPRLLAPLGVAVLGIAALRAAWVGHRRGALEWRGTRYPLAALRAADLARRRPR